MNQKPLVSVVIPTHNRPEFLRKTLQSILNQTYENLQVLTISNGFNQDNRLVINRIQDPRLEYYEQENSGGPASPRNHGIRKAKGEYIAFCDDDDLWTPDKIEKQVNALENNPDYGLCYTKMLRFDDTKEWSISEEEGYANFHSLLYTNVVPVSSIFMRKELIEKHGGFLESRKVGTAEDYEFVLRYALKTKFYFIDEFLLKYWSGDNRTTCLHSRKNIKTVFVYIKTLLNVYVLIYKSNHIPLLNYLKPGIFNLKNSLKVMLYITMQRIGLK